MGGEFEELWFCLWDKIVSVVGLALWHRLLRGRSTIKGIVCPVGRIV